MLQFDVAACAGYDNRMLDWSTCPAVERDPERVSCSWVFRGTRVPVSALFENLEDGMTNNEVMEQFPVSREHLKAVLGFAAHPAARRRRARRGPVRLR